eukprot:TRINITY_DN1124_c0_g1_i10.p1 TRINITY_DN1124_c0_g1~~TRINITY_DN1124_c0_g1_i10.p1  ORF type:complete len:209 (-),score=31.37 TRINITY_DN1124_c0_g1_i10:211-837(-)
MKGLVLLWCAVVCASPSADIFARVRDGAIQTIRELSKDVVAEVQPRADVWCSLTVYDSTTQCAGTVLHWTTALSPICWTGCVLYEDVVYERELMTEMSSSVTEPKPPSGGASCEVYTYSGKACDKGKPLNTATVTSHSWVKIPVCIPPDAESRLANKYYGQGSLAYHQYCYNDNHDCNSGCVTDVSTGNSCTWVSDWSGGFISSYTVC